MAIRVLIIVLKGTDNGCNAASARQVEELVVPDAGRCILCGFHTYSGSDFAAHCETAAHVAQVRARLASSTRSALVSPGTGRICAGTGLTPPTSAPGLRSPVPTSAPGLGSPDPHLHWD